MIVRDIEWCGVDHAGIIVGASYGVPNAARTLAYGATEWPTAPERVSRKWPVSAWAYTASMSNTSVFEPSSSPDAWAEVRAHDRVTRYRRSGAGRPVLVLHSPDDPNPLWPELLETLGAGYRVIMPEPPSAGADVTAWLAGFLEGLGTTSVRIVAADGFCMAALELALLEAVGITRMVLVANGPAAPEAPRGFARSAIGRASVPLLVVRRGQPAHEGVALIGDFLRQEMSAPA